MTEGAGKRRKREEVGGWEVGEGGIVAGKGRKMRKAEFDWGGEERKKMRKKGSGGGGGGGIGAGKRIRK